MKTFDVKQAEKALPRFIAMCEDLGECIVWTGYRTAKGYGRFGFGGGQEVYYAHRWAYLLFSGPIPDGLFLDHLCENKSCVNPEHLEVVTTAENLRRADVGARVAAKNRSKTTCRKGHPRVPSSKMQRCGECAKQSSRKYEEKRKEVRRAAREQV